MEILSIFISSFTIVLNSFIKVFKKGRSTIIFRIKKSKNEKNKTFELYYKSNNEIK